MAAWLIPLLVVIVLTIAFWKRVNVYETMTSGAKDGVTTWIAIVPHVVVMMAAVSVFTASGAAAGITAVLAPLLEKLHMPPDVVQVALIRPVSGAASLALVDQLTASYGADAFVAKLAAIMQGSTDTTLYVLAVYFGAAGITKTGHALSVGLIADAAACLFSLWAALWLL